MALLVVGGKQEKKQAIAHIQNALIANTREIIVEKIVEVPFEVEKIVERVVEIESVAMLNKIRDYKQRCCNMYIVCAILVIVIALKMTGVI